MVPDDPGDMGLQSTESMSRARSKLQVVRSNCVGENLMTHMALEKV
jgi:hypothetical protein